MISPLSNIIFIYIFVHAQLHVSNSYLHTHHPYFITRKDTIKYTGKRYLSSSVKKTDGLSATHDQLRQSTGDAHPLKNKQHSNQVFFPLLKMTSPFGICFSLLDIFSDFSFRTYDNDRNRRMGEAVLADASHTNHTHTLP